MAPNILHLPGENPSKKTSYSNINKDAAALGGTNCFVIGTTEERIMIDSGDSPPINRKFIENLRIAMSEEKFRLKVSVNLL